MCQENSGWVIYGSSVVPAKRVNYQLHEDCVRVFNRGDALKIKNHTENVEERKRIASVIFQGGTFEDATHATP